MNKNEGIQTRLPLADSTPLEAWLLQLGLKAIEVAECPVPECVVCAMQKRRTPKAA
jgi:hypothetical protein